MKKDELNNNHYELVKETMKKARRKMTFRIIRIFVFCLAILFLISNIPSTLNAFQGNRIADSQKMAMLTYEYASPQDIVGYSVDIGDRYSFERGISIYYRNYAGHNIVSSNQQELKLNYNLLSRKLELYIPAGGPFLHPDRYNEMAEQYQRVTDEYTQSVVKALDKNKDTTVTLLNITFDTTYSIEEVMELTSEFDVEINWFAIETGYEGKKPPSYMGMPAQQYYTWGIPAKIYRPENIFDPVTITSLSVEEQVKQAMIDMNWMKDNINLIKKGSVWFLEEDIEAYFNENGVNCYGIQVNGPTDQICELLQSVGYRYLGVQEMSLWFW